MNSAFTKFSIRLFFILSLLFAVHILILKVLKLNLFDNKIILAYIVNYAFAILVFGALYLLRTKFKEQLGFIFLAGSLLKFVAFFILFYPFYKADETISKLEFAAFFIPYVTCLIFETISLVKWLNKLD
jgi:hypothetical protein